MYKKRQIELFIISIPILLLLTGSIYFTYMSWKQYENDTKLQQDIKRGTLLQSIEHSVVNELVCLTIIDQKKQAKICGKMRKTTDNFILQLQEKSVSPYIAFYNKLIDKQTNDTFSPLSKQLKHILQEIRNRNVSHDEIINGTYQKKITDLIQTYLVKLETYSDIPKEKELLRFFIDVSNISYSTEAEKILMAYYLSIKAAVPSAHLIYWDELIWSSEFPDLSKAKGISSLQNILLGISENEKVQNALKSIEDTRISILSNITTGHYTDTSIKWITLLNQKQKALNHTETTVLKSILDDATDRIEKQEQKLVIGIFFSFLSLLFFLYLIGYSRKVSSENKVLANMLDVVEGISDHNKDETVLVSSDTFNNKEDAYDYLTSEFKELYEKEKKAVEENNAKQIYITNISHEIRTPINGISGFIKLLKNTSLTEDQDEFVKLIETSTEHLTTIVGDVLDIAKINANKMDIERISFDIFENIESTVSGFGVEADKKDIVLGVFVDPRLPSHLVGDPTKLTHIFTNLISNAIKFTDEYGTINIFVKQMHADEKEVRIKFIVEDSGIGLSEKQKKKIFEPFNQADISTTRKFGGTGLGLTISQRIIELMGGKLNVNSEEGEGSSFYFTLLFDIDTKNQVKLYPSFEGISVGLALPVRNLDRQIDKNLEKYITYLGASFKIYYYDEIFVENNTIDVPDLMIVYHNYARLEGELESFTKLKCKTILITTASLRLRIGDASHSFADIIYIPMTINKTIRLLRNIKLDTTEKILSNNVNIEKFENLNALVAEDNFINQKLIRILLENLGLTVTLASDGEEVVNLRKKKEYDIIFMDIHMPIINGIEATQMIIEYEELEGLKHIPIISLTGHVKKGDKEKFLNLGIDNYLTKPVQIEEVKRVIGEYFPDKTIFKETK